MAEKTEKKEPVTVKFMKTDCKQDTRAGDIITIKMGKEDYLKKLEADGATKEVLKVVDTALSNFSKNAIEELAEVCKKNKGATIELTAGSGAFSQSIRFTGHKTQTCRNPQTKEQMTIEKYGVVDARLNMGWGKEFKGEDGVLARVSSDLENFFKAKRK